MSHTCKRVQGQGYASLRQRAGLLHPLGLAASLDFYLICSTRTAVYTEFNYNHVILLRRVAQ